MSPNLSLLAGPDALQWIRERGLRGDDIDVVPGASGGPKWLVLAGLDRVLFGGFFKGRSRSLHLIGSSIGSWRLSCLAQADPVAALDRFETAYVEQRYPPRPPPALVSATSGRILDDVLGREGADQILNHPWARLHVVTALCRGLSAAEHPRIQLLGLALAAMTNLASRRTLGLHMERVIFHSAGDTSPSSSPASREGRSPTATTSTGSRTTSASGPGGRCSPRAGGSGTSSGTCSPRGRLSSTYSLYKSSHFKGL